MGKLSRALSKGSQALQIFWMEASEGASGDVQQEQSVDEAGMDLQREQVSLIVALQEARQPPDERKVCMSGDPLKNTSNKRYEQVAVVTVTESHQYSPS